MHAAADPVATPAARAPARGRLWAILLLVVAAAAVPRLYHVRSRFMNFADHNTANFALYARNYLDHGYLRTRLGQVVDTGPVAPQAFTYFAHHSPVVPLLASAAFAAGGRSEASARALPIAASAATCGLLILLARRLVAPPWAVLAGLVLAAAPGAVHFGQMLGHEAFVVLAGLGSILAWCRHAETGGAGAWRLALALLAAATLVDWPGAYVAPALAAASLLAPATRPRAVRLGLQAAATAAAAAIAVAAHIAFLQGSLANLTEALRFRVLSSESHAFTWSEYLRHEWETLGAAATPSLRGLAAGGLAAAILAALLSRRSRGPRAGAPAAEAGLAGAAIPWGPAGRAGLAAAIAISGGLHHLLFTNACRFNENLVYHLMPALAVAAASLPAAVAAAVSGALARMRRRPPWSRAASRTGAAVGLLSLAPFLAGATSVAARQIRDYATRFVHPGWAIVAQAIAPHVPDDGVLISSGSLTSPQLRWYLWRRIGNGKREPHQLGGYGGPIVHLWDRNVAVPAATARILDRRQRSVLLEFDVYDFRKILPPPPRPAAGAAAPEPPGPPDPTAESIAARLAAPAIAGLAPPPLGWRLTDVAFDGGYAVELMALGPEDLRPDRVGTLDRFLGVPWTPESARERLVHALLLWRRSDDASSGPAATPVVPSYRLESAGGGPAAAAGMAWAHEDRDLDLSTLRAGETRAQEVSFFLGEWMPEGTYAVSIALRRGGSLIAGEQEAGAPCPGGVCRLGTIELREASPGAGRE